MSVVHFSHLSTLVNCCRSHFRTRPESSTVEPDFLLGIIDHLLPRCCDFRSFSSPPPSPCTTRSSTSTLLITPFGLIPLLVVVRWFGSRVSSSACSRSVLPSEDDLDMLVVSANTSKTTATSIPSTADYDMSIPSRQYPQE
jgi:hypothetical protein